MNDITMVKLSSFFLLLMTTIGLTLITVFDSCSDRPNSIIEKIIIIALWVGTFFMLFGMIIYK